MLPLEHSAIRLTCIKQLLVLKTNFQSFLESPFYTGFTVFCLFHTVPGKYHRSILERLIQINLCLIAQCLTEYLVHGRLCCDLSSRSIIQLMVSWCLSITCIIFILFTAGKLCLKFLENLG